MRDQSPRWTYIFIAASIAGFLFQQASDFWIYLAFFPIFAFGSPWMFLTSIFLHADFSHLFFNMFALFFFGLYLERAIGGRAFATLFLLSGLLGNLGYMVTSADPLIPAVGASGAIYGIVGALATLAPTMLIFIYGFIPVPMVLAAVLWALVDILGLFAPSGIAHGAHLGGMLVGAAFGIYVRARARLLG